MISSLVRVLAKLLAEGSQAPLVELSSETATLGADLASAARPPTTLHLEAQHTGDLRWAAIVLEGWRVVASEE